MAKKIGIVILIALVLFVFFLPEVTGFAANYAMQDQYKDKGWARGLATTSADINKNFMRVQTANGMYQQVLKTWPDHPERADVEFKICLCYEKMGNATKAIESYDVWIAKYPNHRWHGQAVKHKENIIANQD